MRINIELSEERKSKVYNDLSHGSNPRGSFFLLVALSTAIAAFGLVMNSTAVVIGAMLVAPLMTPILGLALALIRGDAHLLRLAARSEIFGVIVSLAAGVLLGLALPTHFEPTPEMLARVSPNLLDLLVAVFAGLAGAYALVEERLSPVLPGVAISTAIVPPLANSGLCLALGAYEGAIGSFLLFFTNFLSIMLVSGLVFYIAGMGEEIRLRSGFAVARRFGLVVVGLAIVSFFLSIELIKMFEDGRLRGALTQELKAELSNLRVSDMERLRYQEIDNVLMVLVDVNATRVIEPREVKRIQEQLGEIAAKPVELFIRTTVSHDVSASGSTHQRIAESLDGFDFAGDPDKRVQALQVTEQVVREYLDDQIGIHLESLHAYPVGAEMLLVAEIAGARYLYAHEVGELEHQIQDRLPEQPIRLLTRQETTELRAKDGRFRTEFSIPGLPTAEEQGNIDNINKFASDWLASSGYWLYANTNTVLDGKYHFLFEVTGPTAFTAERLESLSADLADALDLPVEIYVRHVPETVIGPEGYTSMEELMSNYFERNSSAFPDEYRELIHESF